MNVGLPGSGIGGVFYLLSALCMPLVALFRGMRARPSGWRMAVRQAAIALGILGGLAITASLAGMLLAQTPLAAWVARGATEVDRVPGIFRAASVMISVGTLACLVLGVWVAALVVHGGAAFRSSTLDRDPAKNPPPRIARVSSDR
jgi:hypothetical protein